MPKDRTSQISLAFRSDPFWNRGLFADHFLMDRIGELDQWKTADGLTDAFAAIDRLYREKASRFRNTTNEAQTERDFVRPVLDILWKENEPGDCYQVQVTIPNVDARRQPDYAFFRTTRELDDAEARKGALEYWRDVPALGDAKAWFAPLDRQRGVDDNPSSQITNYLYRSHVRWGILTNGRIWRLYESEKSRAGGVFFEVDLEDILRRNDLSTFKYFYLFFRREAFLPDASGISFIDHVFQGSVEYASQVGDRLKESVYDALRSLMNGFFEHSANSLDRNDPETVKLVHENCLIVLYRLLFLLYAEDGRLLPCEEEPYHSISLLVLHRQINQNLRSQRPYLLNTTMLWNHVCNLFRLIDEGFREHEKVIIPAYNGGLFSLSHYPQIAHSAQAERRWDIGDRYIAEAIDLLAYKRDQWDQPGSDDIDYKTLDVRHLGSIYEGLLELQPHVANEPLVEILDDGRSVFKPSREVPNPRPIRGQHPHTIGTSEIYLITNRGERKATGSYYTPQYIVDYILENTVGPLVDEASRKVAESRPAIQREIRKLERGRREWERNSPANAGRQIENFNKGIELQKRRLLEPYLDLKILDHAMGSGHFLVGAADFLSLAMANDPNLLAPNDIGDEDPQAHYKRLVVEHCLYGVDLNPLAVELAKLSLWLHTVSRDKALSFLDHHLRRGNSLVGARVEEDLKREPPHFNARGRRHNADSRQLMLGFTEALTGTHLNHFLETFRKIVEAPGGTAEGERWKDTVYREMDAVRDKFRSVAHCWLAPYFGVPVTPEQYQQAVNALRHIPDWEALKRQEWFQNALVVAHEKRFFHWELEFPEVFFNAHGFKPDEERGFDAVIGNPPYVRPHKLPNDIKSFLWQTFIGYVAKSDLLNCFLEKGLELLKYHSALGMITSDTWRVLDSSTTLRELLLNRSLIKLILLLPYGVFEDATVKPVVVVLQKDDDLETQRNNAVLIRDSENHGMATSCVQATWMETPPHIFDVGTGAVIEIKEKIQKVSLPLGDLFTVDFGLKTGDDERFVNLQGGKPDDKMLIASRRVSRYSHDWQGEYVWYRPDLMRSHRQTARPGEPARFERQKIILSRMAEGLVASFDESCLYVKDALLISLPLQGYSLLYVLSLINSRLLNFWYLSTFTTVDTHRNEVMRIPVRRVAFTTDKREREQLLTIARQAYEQGLMTGDLSAVLLIVDQELGHKPDRADFVHDLLASLAEQMLALNEKKQQELKGFRSWLERNIGAKVNDLTNKSRINAYHEHDLNTLLSALRSNRSRLGEGVNPSSRSFQEAIEPEFNNSVEKLEPQKAKIEVTDNLIDEIVFRLYGLTADEIKLVKGQPAAESAS